MDADRVSYLLPWFAVLDHKEDIFKDKDTVEVREKT
jgi:hypothetical protein